MEFQSCSHTSASSQLFSQFSLTLREYALNNGCTRLEPPSFGRLARLDRSRVPFDVTRVDDSCQQHRVILRYTKVEIDVLLLLLNNRCRFFVPSIGQASDISATVVLCITLRCRFEAVGPPTNIVCCDNLQLYKAQCRQECQLEIRFFTFTSFKDILVLILSPRISPIACGNVLVTA